MDLDQDQKSNLINQDQTQEKHLLVVLDKAQNNPNTLSQNNLYKRFKIKVKCLTILKVHLKKSLQKNQKVMHKS